MHFTICVTKYSIDIVATGYAVLVNRIIPEPII